MISSCVAAGGSAKAASRRACEPVRRAARMFACLSLLTALSIALTALTALSFVMLLPNLPLVLVCTALEAPCLNACLLMLSLVLLLGARSPLAHAFTVAGVTPLCLAILWTLSALSALVGFSFSKRNRSLF